MRLPLLTALLACTLPAADGIAVPVVNGDFESGAKGWENAPQLTAEPRHGGGKSLALAKGHVFQSPGAMLPVKSGRDYQIRLWVRTQDCAERGAGVCAMFRAADAKAILGGWIEGADPVHAMDGGRSPVLAAFGGTADWREQVIAIPAQQIPAGAAFLHLYLRNDLQPAGGGTVWFDDLTALELPAGTVPSGPIIKNGGFERGKAGWWGEGTWDVVAGQGADGGAALRVDKGFVCQDKRPVEGRRNYRISMRVRSEGSAENAVFVQTSYRNGDKPLGGWTGPLRWRNEAAVLVTGGTHGWKDHTIVVQAPPAATQILLYLRKQDGAGQAWYDDVTVEATEDKPYTVADRRAAELRAELLTPASADAPAALAAAVALGRGQAGPFVLNQGGRTVASIHAAGTGDAVVLGAVKELRALLAQIAGGAPAVVSHDGNAQAGPLLVVGREGALANALGAGIDWPSLGSDGFVIRTVGKHLLVAGATPRGTMYAVYWLLDRQLGVRWLAPGATHAPAQPELTLPTLDLRQVPRFAYREVLSHEGSDAAFAAHNLMNGRSHGPSYAPTAPEIDTWDHSWMAMGGSADFWELLDMKNTQKAHPEWFSGGQVSMMDKGMRAAMAKEVIERLKAHPDYTRIWYNIWQKDWGWDMDTASKAFAAKHGGHASAPRLDMMIDIAEQVRAVMPGARFAMQAYSWGFTPPEGMTVPDHMLIFPMTIHVDYSTPLNAGRNEKLGADMVGWTRLAKNVQVWDHIANWAGFLQPTPNIYPIGDSIRWLAGQPGLRGYFCEGNWNSAGGEFGALRAWLIARLTWDPSQDPRALAGEWCDLYYGKAGVEVRRYLDLMHASAAKSGDVLGQRYTPDIAMYSFDFVTAADALFARAEAAVTADEVLLKRVQHARMPIDHLILLRRTEFAAAAAARGQSWNADTAVRRARFEQAVAVNRVTEFIQGGSIKGLLKILDIERGVAKPDPKVSGLAATDWADIQDLSFMRFGSSIVADPAASDGAAIRMAGNDSTWSIQLQYQHLPKGGTWELYAAVRVEAEPGHDDDPVVRIGAAPPMGLFNTASGKEMADGAYHLVKVPGGPFHWDDTTGMKTFFAHTFYVQSPAKPWIKHIYLDRIIALRSPAK